MHIGALCLVQTLVPRKRKQPFLHSAPFHTYLHTRGHNADPHQRDRGKSTALTTQPLVGMATARGVLDRNPNAPKRRGLNARTMEKLKLEDLPALVNFALKPRHHRARLGTFALKAHLHQKADLAARRWTQGRELEPGALFPEGHDARVDFLRAVIQARHLEG